jgi:eukaryotic-like serine/threonine-protein kinase
MRGSSVKNDRHLKQQFGNYYLHQKLGQRETSEIYLGTHILFHNPVAIKFMSHLTENDFTRFITQASVLTRLRHPHIVSVLDFGTSDGTAFLVMDYAPNGHLRQRHSKGSRLPLETVVLYVKQVAAALYYIHQHDLVHRDIKPHNMLLGEHDEVMISDFGIAVMTHSLHSQQDHTDDFEGTAPYAAPEQLRGKPCRASDQYSLGVVVYEWLSGNWPFDGSFEEITRKHMFATPPSLQESGVPISPEVEQVILKALAKEPDDRFENIAAFADALEEASNLSKNTEVPPAVNLQHAKRQFLSPRPFPEKSL